MYNKKSSIEEKKPKNIVLLLATFIMVITLFFQSFHLVTYYIVLPIIILWFINIITTESLHYSRREKMFIWASFIFLFIVLLYNLFGVSTLKRGEILDVNTWLTMGVISISALKLFTTKELNKLFVLFTVVIVVLLITFTLIGRYYWAIQEQEEASGIAETWESSMIMLLTGIALIFFVHIKSFIPRLFALAIFLLSAYVTIFIFQRGTNVIFLFAEILLVLFFNIKNKIFVGFLAGLTIVLSVFLFSSDSLITLFEWLENISPSDRLAVRFNTVSTALRYESIQAGGSSLSGRFDLMGISWNTFTSSFTSIIFGVGEHRSNYALIGNHSFVVDTLASYGIIGGFILMNYYFGQFHVITKEISKNTDWSLFWQCVVIMAIYFLRSIYGNMSFGNVNLIVMLYFPLTIRIILNYKLYKNLTT